MSKYQTVAIANQIVVRFDIGKFRSLNFFGDVDFIFRT